MTSTLHHRRDPHRCLHSHPGDRRVVPPERRSRHHPHRELARGGSVIYRGPGKSKEIPLLTTGTTISSKVINVDLDITDQTADIDDSGIPRPIKVRVLASAIVSVGDSDMMIKTAANRFFAKPRCGSDEHAHRLLSSSGRRAINLLTHDQLFSAQDRRRAARAARRRARRVTALVPADARRRICRPATPSDRGRGRSARGDHPQGVLARAHGPRTRSSTR